MHKSYCVIVALLISSFGVTSAFGQAVGQAFGQNEPRTKLPNASSAGLTLGVPGNSAKSPKALAQTLEQRLRLAAITSVTFTGSTATASPAASFALNGNLAYVCGNNEVTIVDIANVANPQVLGTALSGVIQNTGNIYCGLQRGTLVVFSDQISSTVGNTPPAFSAFSLANPQQPQLINSTILNKQYAQPPVYLGNYAFVPTATVTTSFGSWERQFGDLVAYDLTNFSNPVLLDTLERPQLQVLVNNPITSGPTSVFGATQADNALLYLGGSTSSGNTNSGKGRLQIVDISNPAALKLVGQLVIPGSIHFSAPLIQGNVAVGIGNTGGWIGSINVSPLTKGNIVVATFNVTDRRAPTLIASTVTNYSVGAGGGATRIGNNLFAFAGVLDASGNPVLLIVDTNNPQSPVIQAYPVSQPFTSMQAVGSVLYATLGRDGFATFSIPGITNLTTSCPLSIDAMVVFDKGAAVSTQTLQSAKSALKTFVDSLRLSPDQIGVVSFAGAATLDQRLSTNGLPARLALDSLLPGGASYIGSGIAAAQAELTGPRRVSTASPVMIVVSTGTDPAAPSSSATLNAANVAKAAGIRIISLQFGSASPTVMQAIASSPTDYYVVPNP